MANFNSTTPAAPGSAQNIVFAYSGANVSAYSPVMVGDTGSGGKTGAVPAPGSGDTAAGKYLKADGSWAVPAGSLPSGVANRVVASPNGSTGTASLRALVAADIPTLNQSTSGTAANVTGIVAIANGGTGNATGLTRFPGAANDTVSSGFGTTLGSDGTLGSLDFIIRGNPSATGANRWVSIAIIDDSTGGARPLVLNTYNGTLFGPVLVGTKTDNGVDKLQVSGSVTAVGLKSSGGFVVPITTKSAAYTATTSDHSLEGDASSAAFSFTLPVSPLTGMVLQFIKIDASANAITIAGTVNGVVNRQLTAQWQSLKIQYNGSAWRAF